jgi:ABC-type nitrate/sulfonate/bicarbonate transport system permease component
VTTVPHARRTVLARVAIVAALFALWEILSRTGAVNPRLLPSASDALGTLAELARRPRFWSDLLATGSAVALAFVLAVPVGGALGLAVAESPYWGAVLRPLIFFLFSIPKSIFLPMFILAFGIGYGQKVGFGFFSTVLIVAMSTAAAIESVKPDHVTVARSFGATRRQIVARIYLPSMLPVLLEALRIAMIFNFTGVILAEMYAAREGLGHAIANWGENFQMRQLFAGVILVSTLAILFNETIRWAERRCEHWRT